ncbi:MAG: cobalt-precorrin-6A reductase [Actinomycetota bacterium]
MTVKVLVLGGTTEARLLSHHLDADPEVEVTVSLAGRTSTAATYGGTTRVGGFGGVDALAEHLVSSRYDAVIDVTHPFAATMSAHAATAADRAGVPRLRVERPPWRSQIGDRWTEVDDAAAAASTLTSLGSRRALITIGRSDLDAFTSLPDVHLVVRSIEAVDDQSPANIVFIQARSPFGVDDETTLLDHHRIDTLVTKNSGGDDAKLIAARERRVGVVMIRRPAGPPGPTVADVDGALRWVRSLTSR